MCCKIDNRKGNGTGFFCSINEKIKVLITNNHVIDEDIIKEGKKFEVSMNDEKEYKTIKLINKKIYTSKKYDTTIIEINSEDEDIKNYLELDLRTIEHNINKKSIYILHYPQSLNEPKAVVSYGIIKGIVNDYDIIHYSCTDKGSSGSPIVNILNNQVIGTHNGGVPILNQNRGTLLKNPIKEYLNIYNDEEAIELKIKVKEEEIIKNQFNFLNKAIENREYINKVFTTIQEIYNYIKDLWPNKYNKSIQGSKIQDISVNRNLENHKPVISTYEYDKCYFLIHRTFAHFFGDINNKEENPIFKKSYFKIIINYVSYTEILGNQYKWDFISKFENLIDKKNLVESSIRNYTSSSFSYFLNCIMNTFESGLISVAYYIGPFLFGLNKYVKENHKEFGFNDNMILYRNIQCSIKDFKFYELNLKHIICFPYFISTSTIKMPFMITKSAKNLNDKKRDLFEVKMIFNYKHEYGNISPGIIIKNNKRKDGEYISAEPTENEVILFPFTFARITGIEPYINNDNNYKMNLDIINRKNYIEYALRDNFEKGISLSSLD